MLGVFSKVLYEGGRSKCVDMLLLHLFWSSCCENYIFFVVSGLTGRFLGSDVLFSVFRPLRDDDKTAQFWDPAVEGQQMSFVF